MDIPTTLAELQSLIDRQTPESLHLDYKRSIALAPPGRREVSKDVSAFANSDGGVLIYGVQEDGHVPVLLDGGVNNTVISREALEQQIVANIAPRIEGVEIRQIPSDESTSYYTVGVPKSHRAPHQDRNTNKYYKRHNFMSVAMEDYELADLRARARLAAPLVTFDVETRHGTLFLFTIANSGEVPAERVIFDFVPPLTWRGPDDPPAIIRDGIEHLPPGREYVVFYNAIPASLAPDSKVCTEFTVTVSYYHPVAKGRLSESYPINLRDYLGTWPPYSPVEELSKVIEKGLNEVVSEIKSIKQRLDTLASATTASGLNLSVSTLRALELLQQGGDPVTKTSPEGRDGPFFQEVLGVPLDVGWRLARHFWRSTSLVGLLDPPGVTPDILDRVKTYFIVDSDDQSTA